VLRQVVNSSSLRSIGYDGSTRTLEVQFATGNVYQYHQVPNEVWLELKRAASIGRFFQANVRDRYETSRVS
jgi:hypothetical protein